MTVWPNLPPCPVPRQPSCSEGRRPPAPDGTCPGLDLIPQADLARAAAPSHLILKKPPRTPGGCANRGAEAPGGDAACRTDGPRPVALNPGALGPSPSGWPEGRCRVLFCTLPPLFLAEERLVMGTVQPH